MPNWTSNTLTIVSKNMDLLAKVEHEITSVEKDEFTGKTIRLIDFNRIVPMPKTIDTDTVGCEADSFRYYCLKSGKGMLKDYSRYFSKREFTYRKDNKMYDLEDYEGDDCFNHRLEEMYRQGADIYTNITKYGYVSWYDWCNAKWGTKWNASEPFPFEYTDKDRMSCTFDTAWKAPFPIAKEISRKYHIKVILFSNYEGGEEPTKVVYLNGRRIRSIKYDDMEDTYDEETTG